MIEKTTANYENDFSQDFLLPPGRLHLLTIVLQTLECDLNVLNVWYLSCLFLGSRGKAKQPWPLDSCRLPPCSLGLDAQGDLEVLVHHVADADRWNDLHEVGGQASVESRGPLGPHDVSEQARHAHLRASYLGG